MSDRLAQLAEVHGFGDEHVEACAECATPVLRPRMAGAGDRGRAAARLLAAADAADQLVAVLDRHADV
jgi:hypothetical protein